MNTALVTCIYNGLSGTKYGGRNRDKMYRDSLSSIAKSGIPIFCFVFPEHKEELQKYFTDKNLHNVRVIEHDILSEDFHADIMRIKDASPEIYYNGDIFWHVRCPEIMWGKTRLISRIIDQNPEIETIHWIDAGLSNASILRHRYFPNIHLADHYSSEGFFTEKFFTNLSEYSKDGIFAALHTRPNNARIPEHYNETPYSGVNCAMIGGIFGGNVEFMKKFCDSFEHYIHKMLAATEIYSEEAVYTGIFNDNPDLFKPIYFDTFYNEDWPDAYCPSHVSFVQVLETFLGEK